MLMTSTHKITSGQNVHPDKLAFAKQLRREMTPAERRLWKALRRNALDGFHFRRQQVIDGYIADFYCDAAKLAIELDGGVHQEQWQYDESRDKAITRLGVRVLRISNDAMLDVEAVIEHIREALLSPENLTPNPFPKGKGNQSVGQP
jgi:very-short-patch-repair endonuclease